MCHTLAKAHLFSGLLQMDSRLRGNDKGGAMCGTVIPVVSES